jgi:hypothetical protein
MIHSEYSSISSCSLPAPALLHIARHLAFCGEEGLDPNPASPPPDPALPGSAYIEHHMALDSLRRASRGCRAAARLAARRLVLGPANAAAAGALAAAAPGAAQLHIALPLGGGGISLERTASALAAALDAGQLPALTDVRLALYCRAHHGGGGSLPATSASTSASTSSFSMQLTLDSRGGPLSLCKSVGEREQRGTKQATPLHALCVGLQRGLDVLLAALRRRCPRQRNHGWSDAGAPGPLLQFLDVELHMASVHTVWGGLVAQARVAQARAAAQLSCVVAAALERFIADDGRAPRGEVLQAMHSVAGEEPMAALPLALALVCTPHGLPPVAHPGFRALARAVSANGQHLTKVCGEC